MIIIIKSSSSLYVPLYLIFFIFDVFQCLNKKCVTIFSYINVFVIMLDIQYNAAFRLWK